MSDPTYRIDVEHDPGEQWPWKARVWRLTDDKLVGVKVGTDPGEVTDEAQSFIHAIIHTKVPGFSLFVDDDGQRVEAHSVKA